MLLLREVCFPVTRVCQCRSREERQHLSSCHVVKTLAAGRAGTGSQTIWSGGRLFSPPWVPEEALLHFMSLWEQISPRPTVSLPTLEEKLAGCFFRWTWDKAVTQCFFTHNFLCFHLRTQEKQMTKKRWSYWLPKPQKTLHFLHWSKKEHFIIVLGKNTVRDAKLHLQIRKWNGSLQKKTWNIFQIPGNEISHFVVRRSDLTMVAGFSTQASRSWVPVACKARYSSFS